MTQTLQGTWLLQNLFVGNRCYENNIWYEFRYSTGPRAGQELVKVQNEMGQSSIHRAKFLDCLLRLVPKDICRIGLRLQSIDENDDGVTLHYDDGTSAKAHYVIGADGIKSQTRRCSISD